MPNMKGLSITVKKLFAMLKFFKSWLKVTVKDLKVTCPKIMIPSEMS